MKKLNIFVVVLISLVALMCSAISSYAGKDANKAHYSTRFQEKQRELFEKRKKIKPAIRKYETRSKDQEKMTLRPKKGYNPVRDAIDEQFIFEFDQEENKVANAPRAPKQQRPVRQKKQEVEFVDEDVVVESADMDATEEKNPESDEESDSYDAPDDLVFNSDCGKTRIGNSRLVKGQKGLFASARIEAGTIIGWYVGRNYRSEELVQELPKEKSEYVMNVVADPGTVNERILYYISGAEPSPVLGAVERCKATYVNHSQVPAKMNAEYLTAPAHGPGSLSGRGILLRATRVIERGEEILADYGDEYHARLKAAGILAE